ncbi:biotin/lipoyl-containing protein [Candidatus Galacturonibacter soehngenii]|uniref:Acetyl-CoA carboxylase biotin carboxyl carrier protein subunit n=1 Tax=Candidatus Galacturonatibacter soehngenii TaxID=2307010 RepID=A0A7V7QLL0_9FIRM|nr:biotin/lipoyl-containing protein [Candidatus Galacturonibacter soehngenii]KAB1439422.1 acetyl-CoA carboxylase biotin carboxyl carrier protein subunit [Candidatus Galacturonibacter soehngenii]MBA4687286.1 acetyl-CoA carboxylase biotin carboxyl carrier protein subunit [Candidatus Galacturonibacter soehngenii]
MKNYTITVNGNVYDVTVEEVTKHEGANIAGKPAALGVPKVPTITPHQTTSSTKPSIPSVGQKGAIIVEAGAAGKVFRVEASVGQSVKKGDTIVVIEAMKMEIPVVAPEDGTVASIDVAVGDAIEAGKTLATLN